MKVLSVLAFLAILLLLPSICYSSEAIPPLEEVVTNCKEFLNSYIELGENSDSLKPYDLFAQHTLCSQSAVYKKLISRERSLLDSISNKAREARDKIKYEAAPLIEQVEKYASYLNSKWEPGSKDNAQEVLVIEQGNLYYPLQVGNNWEYETKILINEAEQIQHSSIIIESKTEKQNGHIEYYKQGNKL